MNAVAASVLPLKRYAEFGGRSTRTELLAFHVLTGLVAVAVGALAKWLGQDAWRPWLDAGLVAIFLLPTLALFVRRLHDWGRSGWWLLVATPAALAVIWELTARPRPFTRSISLDLPWWMMVPALLCLLALWALLLWDDDVDANRYGRNPRGWLSGEPA
ncbi:MAG TPA: DUF805 domain-containing protein [Allosphingosinicella sp.]|nr:DUF805 domain-containing protein [Allosphingosinicella sp.]